MTAKSLTFIADAMLGKLAKWLRILGYDVVYEPFISDDGLIARAIQGHRIILTMDRKLTERKSAKNSLLIRSPYYREQLKQVITAYHVGYQSGIFTRCLPCNTQLVRIDKEQVKDKVPPYVYSTHDEFDVCPQCNRLYWSGTHRVKMLEMLEEILK